MKALGYYSESYSEPLPKEIPKTEVKIRQLSGMTGKWSGIGASDMAGASQI